MPALRINEEQQAKGSFAPMFGHKSRSKQYVAWWTPRWSYAPELWHELRKMLQPAFVARVTVMSLVVFAGIVVGAKAVFPLLQFDFLWRALLAVPAFYLIFSLQLAVLIALPEYVVIRKDRVLVSHGDHSWVYDANSILATRLVIFAPDRIRLRIVYAHKSKRRSRTVGVAPSIDLTMLCDLLPVAPAVWDARPRWPLCNRWARDQAKKHEPLSSVDC